MRKIYPILLLSLLNIFSLSAIEGLRFENITNKNGLSHNTVRCIMQDSRGFMWISTINGLNRYDGYKFVLMQPEFGAFSLAENNIKYTTEDTHGHIWIQTTSRFINYYNTHTESFVDYTGKNETRSYRNIKVKQHGDVWLWGIDNGACHTQYDTDGVPHSELYDINNIGTNVIGFVCEDTSGQIWIGTDKGLIQIINNIPKYCNTGNHSYSYHSAIELKERIYFFTNNNIMLVFDKKRKVFLPPINFPQAETLTINHTAKLDDSRILIAAKQATWIFDTASGRFIGAQTLFKSENLKEANILTDNKGNNWVYNKSGNLWRYNATKEEFEKFSLIPSSVLPVIDMERYDIYYDSRGITWITTFGNGLFAIEETGKVTHFTAANSELRTNYLLSVSEDRSGDIWIGTEHTGISKISITKNNNQRFIPNPEKTKDADKIIRSIYEDTNNNDIWLGTKSGDVYLFDSQLKEKRFFPLNQGIPYCITADKNGNIWIGTKGNGLLVIPRHKKSIKEAHTLLLSDDNKTGANNIYSLLCDHKGRMWVGTFGKGLFLCEYNDGHFQATECPDVSNKQKQVRCMLEDSRGRIWVGGESGVVVFNPDSLQESNSHQLSWYHFDRSNPESLNNNIVKSIIEDSNHQIWIGTSGGGLNLAIEAPQTNSYTFRHYTSEEGLINNMVQAILEDDNQNLWISTESGISKFNTDNSYFENYSFPDTWESDLFSESTACKRKNGELLFGSHNGMYIFNPSLFEDQSHALPVTITGLNINGIPVTPNSPDSPLKGSITEAQTITLNNRQNSFSIEFSSLNFQSSYSNRYTYILENYDTEWNPITQYNIATYKNIPAGKYRFKVKSCNISGNRNQQETVLTIIVVPPFWKSTQALILYFLISIGIVYFSTKLIIKMNKLHNEVEIEKQLTEFRLRFFTNISHEFRTPLTIIRGSIESINNLSPLPAALKKHIKTLDKSSSKLMRLIEQLLEFRKMQNDHTELHLEYIEAVNFVRGIFELFAETAERNHIHFTFSSNQESKVTLLDKGKVEKIVFNLLSNAFKHTPENGNIVLKLTFDEDTEKFILEVSDSGIGIPKEKQDLLFVRFKQINYSASGIGIGLHLTAELTHVHKGEIKYSDSQWGGACFTVSLPTSADSYDPKDIIDPSSLVMTNHTPVFIDQQEDTDVTTQENKTATSRYKVLIIEDDEEIRFFLEDQLKSFFTILTAPNGLIGFETANSEQPSLIVCDVMMPEMDGFEVTRKLKSDIQTSHIPIILLTAHSSMKHQLEGINAGADSYIIKPFSTQYLISRIIKLIEQREKLQYKFAHEPGTIQTTICTSNKDNEFIAKIHAIIEEHLDDSDFSVDNFAQAANMGRTIFYKKIKGITNLSPNEYIRVVRLKKATELLQNSQLNISEIAYKVGFNDPFYFSKCFKEQFGMRPTQFREERQKKQSNTEEGEE